MQRKLESNGVPGFAYALSGSNGQHAVESKQHEDIEVALPTVREVDYEEQARFCGESAYRRAKQLGLSEAEAVMFREVFGEPMANELRQ